MGLYTACLARVLPEGPGRCFVFVRGDSLPRPLLDAYQILFFKWLSGECPAMPAFPAEFMCIINMVGMPEGGAVFGFATEGHDAVRLEHLVGPVGDAPGCHEDADAAGSPGAGQG